MKGKIRLSVEFDFDDLCSKLGYELTYQQVYYLIAYLDEYMYDQEFTNILIRHFKALEEQYLKECKEDNITPHDLSPLKIDTDPFVRHS